MKHIFRIFNGWNDREKRLIFDVENPEKPATNNEKNDAPPEAPKDPTKIKEGKVDETKKTVDEVNKDANEKQDSREKFEKAKNDPELQQSIQEMLKNESVEARMFVESLLAKIDEMKEALSPIDFKNALQAMINIGPQRALNYMSVPPDQRDAPELQEDRAVFEAAFSKLDLNGKQAFAEVANLLIAQGANENNNNPGKNGKEIPQDTQKKLKENAENALPKPEEAKKLSQGDLDRRVGSVMMNFGVSVMVNAETKEMTVVPPTSGWDKFFNTIVGAGMYLLSYYSEVKQKFGNLFNKQAAAPATTPAATETPEQKTGAMESKQRIEQEMKSGKTLEQLKTDRIAKRAAVKEKIDGKNPAKGLKEQSDKAEADVKTKKDEIENLKKLRETPNLADDEKAKRDADVRKAEGDLKKMEEDAAKLKKQLEEAQKELTDVEADLATIEEMLKNSGDKDKDKEKEKPAASEGDAKAADTFQKNITSVLGTAYTVERAGNALIVTSTAGNIAKMRIMQEEKTGRWVATSADGTGTTFKISMNENENYVGSKPGEGDMLRAIGSALFDYRNAVLKNSIAKVNTDLPPGVESYDETALSIAFAKTDNQNVFLRISPTLSGWTASAVEGGKNKGEIYRMDASFATAYPTKPDSVSQDQYEVMRRISGRFA